MIKLRCIDDNCTNLTFNKIYDCYESTEKYYRIRNDYNFYGGYLKIRFKDVTREFKLKKLNN